MKILVAGATGTVGQHVVTQALARGHTVTAVARHTERLRAQDQNLTKVAADVLDPAAIEPQLHSVDAVISTVGVGASKEPTTLYSKGTDSLLRGMSQHGVERIVVISSQVADHWAQQPLLGSRPGTRWWCPWCSTPRRASWWCPRISRLHWTANPRPARRSTRSLTATGVDT